LQPDVPVIFTTGYTSDLPQLRAETKAGAGILQKPYSPNVLAAKVREVLDRVALEHPA